MSEISDRLRDARISKGFEKASDAAERFGWTYSTYAGHENGHRGIKPPDLQKYARAFGVTVEWLMTGKANVTPFPAQKNTTEKVSGFSEGAVEPYHAPTDQIRLQLQRLAQAMRPDSKTVASHRLTRDVPGFSMLSGDILLIDIRSTQPRPGDLVVVSIRDESSASAYSALRQATSRGLIAPYGDPEKTPTEREQVFGVVLISIRAPGGAT